jgi:hypothetical protein
MQDVNVLVVFYSRFGTTERLALAAAVGAVQSRANIRLRRLADAADETTIAGVPGWRENRDRMNREYVTPRESDVRWADAILLGIPSGSAEAALWFEWLETLRRNGVSAPGIVGSFLPVEDAPEVTEAACLQGRAIADAARAARV